MLIILPLDSYTKRIYACSTDYALCARLIAKDSRAKLKKLIPFSEAEYLIAIERYSIEAAIRSRRICPPLEPCYEAQYGEYIFRLGNGARNYIEISCKEAIEDLEKAFSNNIIREPRPRKAQEAYRLIRQVYPEAKHIYILTPWRTWTIEKAPNMIKIRRIIISNSIALLMP